jgi:drug/metabolite transporter (DMT)-like permease
MSSPAPYLPVVALLFSAAYWGVVWYPLRLLESAGLNGPWQTLVSYAAATLVYLPFAWRRDHAWQTDPAGLLLLGVAAGWANLAFVLAMLEGTVVRVILLFYLSPLWATLLARWMVAEAIHPLTALTLPLGLFGAGLMLWDPGTALPLPRDASDWLAVSAGFAFALSNVQARRLQNMSIATKTLAAWLGVVVVSALALAVLGEGLPPAEPVAWLGAAALGVLGFMTATLALIYGVTHMPAQRSSVIMLFEILVGALTAWWLAGELLGTREWLGGMMIIAAGLVSALRKTD